MAELDEAPPAVGEASAMEVDVPAAGVGPSAPVIKTEEGARESMASSSGDGAPEEGGGEGGGEGGALRELLRDTTPSEEARQALQREAEAEVAAAAAAVQAAASLATEYTWQGRRVAVATISTRSRTSRPGLPAPYLGTTPP